jgi:hypothetical protein
VDFEAPRHEVDEPAAAATGELWRASPPPLIDSEAAAFCDDGWPRDDTTAQAAELFAGIAGDASRAWPSRTPADAGAPLPAATRAELEGALGADAKAPA